MADERDETRSFSPFDDATWADDADRPGRGRSDDRLRRPSRTPDDRARPQPHPADDATRPPSRGPDDATQLESRIADDATRVQPGVGDDRARPQPRAAGEPTVVGAPPVDATSVMPPADGNPAWSGRAEVRAPQPGQTTYQQEVDWPGGPGTTPRDRWWMPIVVGIIVLILLAALGWGAYLIFQNAGKNDNSPGPATTTSAAAPSTAATTESTEPSSAPTTTSPTPTESTTNPTDEAVPIPALRGLSVADAKAALHRVGINSTRVIYRPSDAQQDTVIDSDPEEGQEVPPDTTVTLVVAAPSTTTPTATATATGTTGN